MALGPIRAAIKAAMESVPDVGTVTDYEPWATREEDLRRFFKPHAAAPFRGWTITRESTGERAVTHDSNFETHLMVIRGYQALTGEGASEREFQDLVETVRDRLRQEEVGLFGQLCQFAGPATVRIVEARLYAGVLVHYCEIVLPCTEHVSRT